MSAHSSLGLNDTFVPSSITETDFGANSTSSSQMPTNTNVTLEGAPSAVLTGANVTINSTANSVASDQYVCHESGDIISIAQVCDGIHDCPQTETSPGGEDEDNCGDSDGSGRSPTEAPTTTTTTTTTTKEAGFG